MRERRPGVRGMLLACLLLVSSHALAADPPAGLSAAGWEESTPGRWNSLGERTAQVLDNGVSGAFVLAPGTGVAWEKNGSWDPAKGAVLALEMLSDGTNGSSKDYAEFGRRFPVAVTAVFGGESIPRSLKSRVGDFFVRIWRGFPPAGIRLTYAFGNRAPVGSMYRPGDDAETVFILAGEDDLGKKVAARRDLMKDFQAAYGRDPKGPVTRLIVQTVRPSDEKGPLRTTVRVTFPAP